jgi:hypothetical protein
VPHVLRHVMEDRLAPNPELLRSARAERSDALARTTASKIRLAISRGPAWSPVRKDSSSAVMSWTKKLRVVGSSGPNSMLSRSSVERDGSTRSSSEIELLKPRGR